MITISIPYPPSVNGLTHNKKSGGRGKSNHYEAWIKEAGTQVMIQRVKWAEKSIDGLVSVKLIFARPDKIKRDLDNLLKAPIDLLVRMNIIEDDQHVQSLIASWGGDEPAKIEVSAYAI